MSEPIVTATVGGNKDVFPNILALYAKDGDVIADVTYGKGVFWRSVDESPYTVLKSDIMTGVDFNNLPYKQGSINMVVFDPPYMGHNGGKNYAVARNYNVTVPKYHKDYIQRLYFNAMAEARNALCDGGILVVKCQDEIQSGKQNMNHITIINEAMASGFIIEDLFIMVQKNKPLMRHNYQLHARKNHSYFIVFKKKRAVSGGRE